MRDSCGRGSQPEIEKENLEKVKSTTIRDLPGNGEPWQLRESCGGGSHPEIEKAKIKITIDKNINKCLRKWGTLRKEAGQERESLKRQARSTEKDMKKVSGKERSEQIPLNRLEGQTGTRPSK